MTTLERRVVRPPRSWFDGTLALLLVAASSPVWVRATVCPVWVSLAVGIATTAPIALRRLWPVRVFVWVLVLNGVAGIFDGHLVSGLVLVVALYTVAAWQPWRVTAVSAVALEIGAIAAAIHVRGSGWWFAAIFLTGMVVAAAGLGLYAATRRAYLNELHDRAERFERERDQANELAVITERSRIVREMHDVVAHNLTVIVTLSDAAAAAVAADPERAAEVMRTVSATGRQAIADTRQLLGVLSDDGADIRHPVPGLDGLDGLVAGVRAAGLPVSYEIYGSAAPLNSGAQLTVYRLVQEALTNTLKHGSGATHATVRLHYLPGELLVEVEDDGAITHAPASVTIGRGLTGMRERVLPFDGKVDAGPRAPKGWRVTAQLHLEQRVEP